MKSFLKHFDEVWSRRFYEQRKKLDLSVSEVAQNLVVNEYAVILLEKTPSKVPLDVFYQTCLIYQFSQAHLFELVTLNNN